MTTREDYEHAARAAGIELYWDGAQQCFIKGENLRWKPLSSDGDSRRLEVDCKIDVEYFQSDVMATRMTAYVIEPLGTDPYAATRLAVFRCAVATGRHGSRGHLRTAGGQAMKNKWNKAVPSITTPGEVERLRFTVSSLEGQLSGLEDKDHKIEQLRDELARSKDEVVKTMLEVEALRKEYRDTESLWMDAKRLAMELECLLMSCDLPAVSKWWDSSWEALELHRKLVTEKQEQS